MKKIKNVKVFIWFDGQICDKGCKQCTYVLSIFDRSMACQDDWYVQNGSISRRLFEESRKRNLGK